MAEIEEMGDYVAFKDKDWNAEIGDKEINLGLVCEATDMESAVGGFEDDKYPISLNCSVMVNPKDMSKKYKDKIESYSDDKTNIFDAYSYDGGIPATHFLDGISGSAKTTAKCIQRDGKWGKGMWCESEDDALQYAKDIYQHNAQAMFGLIGFLLDQPINRIGNSGWDIVEHQAFGIDYIDKALSRHK